MGRTTSILISKNASAKTHQTQTIWFGDGEIRLNGETGTYIGKYAKNGSWWNAEVYFGGEVQELSQPTATQAAEAVAWAWLACKALEGLAAAAAYVLDGIEREELARIEQAQYDYEYAQEAEREAAAEATWQEYRANGSWWYIVTKSNNYLVFNAAEERAFYTTQEGELYREVEAKNEVNFALTCWNSPTIHPYNGEVFAHYFRASFADTDKDDSARDAFRSYVDFNELETPQQASAYIFISESQKNDEIPEWAMNVDFRWKLSFLNVIQNFTYEQDVCKAKREEHRTIIATCTP